MSENLDIEKEFYGSLYERLRNEARKKKAATRPKPEDYNLPRTQTELDILLQKMKDCGIDTSRAMVIIKEKKEKFDKDCAEYEANTN